ncbi:glycoside hydrolase family 43 protein [Pedobacter alpinus]|uniref:Glycoside hydrolase family 43 protein n=1 Tax=Pedobacter alpinus TaxID=1590643 RepID=A0ABW5TUY7_9SPHI
MKNCNRWRATKLALLFSVLGNICFAQNNPVVQTKYTADPAPFVYKDTVFLYTTHDEDDAKGFKMLNWLLYTSTDMANWTDRGIVASLDDFSWGTKGNGAWALQVIERDGKFYMYCPMHGKGLGVLVADNPYGPFKDPLNKKLIETDHTWNDIDPSPFIDDDGQAYLYWGNPDLYCVKLNKDMISYSGEVIKVASKPANYQEGPWVWKREGHYYLAYASTCCPEGIGYAMSTSPLGPWEYKGMVMDATKRSNGNHPGIIDYKGKSYTFGLNYELLRKISPEHSERRSVSVAEMTYNADGTIQTLPFWLPEGVAQVENFNPFRRVEAETIAWAEGLKTERNPVSGMYVTNIDNNDYLKVRGVDFGKGAKKFEASLASVKAGSTIEIRIDSLNGPLISVCKVKPSGDLNKWSTSLSKLKKTKEVHDVYFVFKGEGGELFNFDWWKFY